MPTLQQQIVANFLTELAKFTEVSTEKIEKLRYALSAPKKPKVDDLVKIFADPDRGDIL